MPARRAKVNRKTSTGKIEQGIPTVTVTLGPMRDVSATGASSTAIEMIDKPPSATLPPTSIPLRGILRGRDDVSGTLGGPWSREDPPGSTGIRFEYLTPDTEYTLTTAPVPLSGVVDPATVVTVKARTLAASITEPAPAPAPAPTGSTSQLAAQSEAFVESISITMHFNYVDVTEVQNSHWPAFRDLRARHWRDGGPNDANWRNKVRIMCQGGARGTVTIDPRDGNNPDTVVGYLKSCFAEAGAHSIERIEGCNELDINGSVAWNGQILWTDGGDTTGIRNFQRLIYERVKADAATRHVIVCAPSIAHPQPGDAELAQGGGVVNYCDEINGHWYQGGAVPDDQWPTGTGTWPNGAWGGKWAEDDRQKPGAPIFISETGFHLEENRSGQPGITQNAACKYIPRVYLEAWWRTVLYGRKIQASVYNLSHDGWSCMLVGGTRLPSYYSLQAMIRLFEDQGPSFTPVPFQGSVNISASGDLRYFVLNRRNGKHDVVAWRNARSCIQGQRTDINVSRVNVVVSGLPTARAGVVFRPSTANTVSGGISTANAQESTGSGTSHTFAVGDEPTILRLT